MTRRSASPLCSKTRRCVFTATAQAKGNSFHSELARKSRKEGIKREEREKEMIKRGSIES